MEHVSKHYRAVALFAGLAAVFFAYAYEVRSLEKDAAQFTANLLERVSVMEQAR